MRNFRKIIVVAVTMFILLGVTVTPAYAWGIENIFKSSSADKDLTGKLDKIDEQIWELSENDKLMKFINLNMWDQNFKVCVIDITEKDHVLKSYYIYREQKGNPATISTVATGLVNSWTFNPTLKQTKTGLKILDSKSLSVQSVLKCLYLWISVEKTEDVPPISKIIEESSWIDGFLPKWWK